MTLTHNLSRRHFLHASLAAGLALRLPRINFLSRDVVAVFNMIQLNLFGDVLHCVGGPEHLTAISLFLGINRGDCFTQKSRITSGNIETTLLKTANGKTVTLYDDRSQNRPYGKMLRVEGTRGIWLHDLNQIYLHGISPTPTQWEDFTPYRMKYAQQEFSFANSLFRH